MRKSFVKVISLILIFSLALSSSPLVYYTYGKCDPDDVQCKQKKKAKKKCKDADNVDQCRAEKKEAQRQLSEEKARQQADMQPETDPQAAGDKAWATCKQEGGDDTHCREKAEKAYLEVEKQHPVDDFTKQQHIARDTLRKTALEEAGGSEALTWEQAERIRQESNLATAPLLKAEYQKDFNQALDNHLGKQLSPEELEQYLQTDEYRQFADNYYRQNQDQFELATTSEKKLADLGKALINQASVSEFLEQRAKETQEEPSPEEPAIQEPIQQPLPETARQEIVNSSICQSGSPVAQVTDAGQLNGWYRCRDGEKITSQQASQLKNSYRQIFLKEQKAYQLELRNQDAAGSLRAYTPVTQADIERTSAYFEVLQNSLQATPEERGIVDLPSGLQEKITKTQNLMVVGLISEQEYNRRINEYLYDYNHLLSLPVREDPATVLAQLEEINQIMATETLPKRLDQKTATTVAAQMAAFTLSSSDGDDLPDVYEQFAAQNGYNLSSTQNDPRYQERGRGNPDYLKFLDAAQRAGVYHPQTGWINPNNLTAAEIKAFQRQLYYVKNPFRILDIGIPVIPVFGAGIPMASLSHARWADEDLEDIWGPYRLFDQPDAATLLRLTQIEDDWEGLVTAAGQHGIDLSEVDRDQMITYLQAAYPGANPRIPQSRLGVGNLERQDNVQISGLSQTEINKLKAAEEQLLGYFKQVQGSEEFSYARTTHNNFTLELLAYAATDLILGELGTRAAGKVLGPAIDRVKGFFGDKLSFLISQEVTEGITRAAQEAGSQVPEVSPGRVLAPEITDSVVVVPAESTIGRVVAQTAAEEVKPPNIARRLFTNLQDVASSIPSGLPQRARIAINDITQGLADTPRSITDAILEQKLPQRAAQTIDSAWQAANRLIKEIPDQSLTDNVKASLAGLRNSTDNLRNRVSGTLLDPSTWGERLPKIPAEAPSIKPPLAEAPPSRLITAGQTDEIVENTYRRLIQDLDQRLRQEVSSGQINNESELVDFLKNQVNALSGDLENKVLKEIEQLGLDLPADESQRLAQEVKNQILNYQDEIISQNALRVSFQTPPGSEAAVAIGDIHGDWEQLKRILQGNPHQGGKIPTALVDAQGNWVGGQKSLIITGDLLDRAPEGLDSVVAAENVMRLQSQARKAGGEVVITLGNHDAAAICVQKYLDEFLSQGMTLERAASKAMYESPIMPGPRLHEILTLYHNPQLKAWLENLPAIYKHGDDLFLHSDVLGPDGRLVYFQYGQTIEQINRQIGAILKSQDPRMIAKLAKDLTGGSGQRNAFHSSNIIQAVQKILDIENIYHGHTQGTPAVFKNVTNLDMGLSGGYSGDLPTRGFASFIEPTVNRVPIITQPADFTFPGKPKGVIGALSSFISRFTGQPTGIIYQPKLPESIENLGKAIGEKVRLPEKIQPIIERIPGVNRLLGAEATLLRQIDDTMSMAGFDDAVRKLVSEGESPHKAFLITLEDFSGGQSASLIDQLPADNVQKIIDEIIDEQPFFEYKPLYYQQRNTWSGVESLEDIRLFLENVRAQQSDDFMRQVKQEAEEMFARLTGYEGKANHYASNLDKSVMLHFNKDGYIFDPLNPKEMESLLEALIAADHLLRPIYEERMPAILKQTNLGIDAVNQFCEEFGSNPPLRHLVLDDILVRPSAAEESHFGMKTIGQYIPELDAFTVDEQLIRADPDVVAETLFHEAAHRAQGQGLGLLEEKISDPWLRKILREGGAMWIETQGIIRSGMTFDGKEFNLAEFEMAQPETYQFYAYIFGNQIQKVLRDPEMLNLPHKEAWRLMNQAATGDYLPLVKVLGNGDEEAGWRVLEAILGNDWKTIYDYTYAPVNLSPIRRSTLKAKRTTQNTVSAFFDRLTGTGKEVARFSLPQRVRNVTLGSFANNLGPINPTVEIDNHIIYIKRYTGIDDLVLTDGTVIRPGDKVGVLHLTNLPRVQPSQTREEYRKAIQAVHSQSLNSLISESKVHSRLKDVKAYLSVTHDFFMNSLVADYGFEEAKPPPLLSRLLQSFAMRLEMFNKSPNLEGLRRALGPVSVRKGWVSKTKFDNLVPQSLPFRFDFQPTTKKAFSIIKPIYAQETGKSIPVNSSLYKKMAIIEALDQKIQNDPDLTLDETLLIISKYETLEPQMEREGDIIKITTGEGGYAQYSLPAAYYKFEVDPVEGYTVTKPAAGINLGTAENALVEIGVREGKSQVTTATKIQKESGFGRLIQNLRSLLPSFFPTAFAESSEASQGAILGQKTFGELLEEVQTLTPENQDKTQGTITLSLYHDSNGNGIKEKGEENLSWAGLTITLIKETQEATYTLLEGWNFVSFPLVPQSFSTASELITQAARQDAYITTVARWNNSQWEEYIQRGDQAFGQDFPIEPGVAYMLRNHIHLQKWQISGFKISSAIPLELSAGFNGVGIPYSQEEHAASTVLDGINLVKADRLVPESENADLISRFESGNWDSFVKRIYSEEKIEEYGHNFVIDPIEGYFIRVKRSATWTP